MGRAKVEIEPHGVFEGSLRLDGRIGLSEEGNPENPEFFRQIRGDPLGAGHDDGGAFLTVHVARSIDGNPRLRFFEAPATVFRRLSFFDDEDRFFHPLDQLV